MSDVYIDPINGHQGGDGSQGSPYQTFAQVNARLVEGTTLHCAAGRYADAPVFAGSGTAAAPIRVTGEGECIIPKLIRLDDRQWIELAGLTLLSTTQGWLTFNGASEHITLDGCTLSCEETPGAALPYTGAIFKGAWHRFVRSRIAGWLHGDAIEIASDYTLVEDVDCSACDSPHGVFTVTGSHNIVRGSDREHPMVITNRWDRGGECVEASDRGPSVENLFENMVMHQCNYDGSYPIPDPYPAQTPGSDQIMKLGGDGAIYRNLTIELSYRAPAKDFPYSAAMQIGNFGSSSQFKNQRHYFCRYLDNQLNALAVTINSTLPHDYSNNHWFNCEFRGNPCALFVQGGIDQAEMPVIHNCLIADTLKVANVDYDLAAYEERYRALAWANSDGSVPVEAAPLARVAQDATAATVIDLDDARGIFDGQGMIAGDVLVIGQNPPATVVHKISPTQVELAAPVTVAAGDAVWLDYWLPAPEPEPEPEPERTLTLKFSGTITIERVKE